MSQASPACPFSELIVPFVRDTKNCTFEMCAKDLAEIKAHLATGCKACLAEQKHWEATFSLIGRMCED
jgi:hypothetical protein